MPSTTDLNYSTFAIKSLQLITPRPLPTRAQPFSTTIAIVNEEFFVYPHQKSIYLVNVKDPFIRQEIRHSAAVTFVAVSPRGSCLLAGDCNGRVRSWSLPSLQEKMEWQVLSGAVRFILFGMPTDDGEEVFFVCGEGREYFTVAVAGEKMMPLSGPTKTCSSICITAGTKLLIGSADFTCTAYDISAPFPRQAPKFIKTLSGGHSNAVLSLCGNEKYCFSAGADGVLISYSPQTLDIIGKQKCHNGAILASILNDTGLYTASTDGFICLWNPLGNFEKVAQSSMDSVKLPEGQVCSLAAASNGGGLFVTRLSGMIEGFHEGTLERNPERDIHCGHSKGIIEIISGADGVSLQTKSYDGEVQTWQIRDKVAKLIKADAFEAQATAAHSAAASATKPEGAQVMASGTNFTAWSDSQHSIHLLQKRIHWCHHAARVDALCWIAAAGADDEILLSAGVDGNLMAWSAQREREPVAAVKLAHSAPITGIAALKQHESSVLFATIGQDATIRLWGQH